MFPFSTQKQCWMFTDENDLIALRQKTNSDFIEKHGTGMTVSNFCLFVLKFKRK